ncbi:MAG TPA: hypothetical protein VG713_00475 [Pirellulales bacterium]|nr:hypothetical protein [Pirellulales bacterium]
MSSLTESPWPWFLMFVAAALVALAVIGPKHQRRQERLVRMADQRARQQLPDDQRTTAAPQPADDATDSRTSVRGLYFTLAGILTIVATIMLVRRRADRAQHA